MWGLIAQGWAFLRISVTGKSRCAFGKGTTVTSAIAVVAHHDDALLWVGGTIKRTLRCGWDWTVVAMCVQSDEKKSFFDDWCKSLSVRHDSRKLHDYPNGNPFSANKLCDMREKLLSATQKEKFDFVFTHTPDGRGEYGPHPNHLETAETVLNLANKGKLCKCPTHVLHFAYAPIYGLSGRATVARTDACWYVQLSYDELLWKSCWCNSSPW